MADPVLKDVKELLHHDYLAKDEAPKSGTAKAWGKPIQAPQTAVKSLLEIEEEQKQEKEKLEEQQKGKPGVYQAKNAPQSTNPGAYHRPERSDGPVTSFESYQRDARPRQNVPVPNHPPYTAYIGNLPFNVTEDQLGEYFDGLEIKEIRLVKNSDGRSKGFAFVEFDSADSLRNSLTANGEPFGGRNMTVEVQPPRTGGFGGDRSFGGSSQPAGEDKYARWGPTSGQGPASSLGAQAGQRNFERREGGFGERREGGFGERRDAGLGGRDFEADNRQWRTNTFRGKEQPSPITSIPQRPKLDLKPRTITEDIGRPVERNSSEDPFGGAVDPEKAKKQAEIQAQREAETSAKHRLPTTTQETHNKWDNKSGNTQQEERGGWRNNNSRPEVNKQNVQNNNHNNNDGGDKYRFNRGGHPHEQRAPQRNTQNKDSKESNTGNTFASLSNNKW